MDVKFDEEKFIRIWTNKLKKEIKVAKQKNDVFHLELLEKELKKYKEK